MMGDDRRTAIETSLSPALESRRLLARSHYPGSALSYEKRSAFGSIFGYAPQDRDLITRMSCGGARRSVSYRIDALFVMTMGPRNFAAGPRPRSARCTAIDSILSIKRRNKSMFKKIFLNRSILDRSLVDRR